MSKESSSTSCQSISADDAPGTKQQSVDKTNDVETRHAIAPATETVSMSKKKKKKKGTNKSSKNKEPEGNELSHLIPGYTAPMRLEAKSLKGITGTSLAELRNRASRGDSTTYSPSISILSNKTDALDPAVAAKKVKTPASIALQHSSGRGGKIPTSFSGSFRKGPRKQHDNTAGSGWFGMNPTPMTDQLKTDLSIIRNRNYLDPKKFYKSADSFAGKVLQVGTVIEGNSEFYSSRLAKRERRQNLTEEIMADSSVANYAKRKYNAIQVEKERPAGKKSKKGRRGRH